MWSGISFSTCHRATVRNKHHSEQNTSEHSPRQNVLQELREGSKKNSLSCNEVTVADNP